MAVFFDAVWARLEFPDMIHGWTVRGDMSVQQVDRDIRAALDLTIDFIRTHMG